MRKLQGFSRESIVFSELHEKSIGLDEYSLRRIPKNYSNITGYVPSTKNKGSVAFESKLERDFYLLLEFQSNVETYTAQPITIKPEKSDKKPVFRQYTPDVLVNYSFNQQKSELCEIKYRTDMKKKWPKFKAKFKAARKVCKENDWRFRIVTEREVYSPYFDNAMLLLPYSNMEVDQNIFVRMLNAINELEGPTPKSVMNYCFSDQWDQARAVHILWHAIGAGLVFADLDKKLTMQSPLWTL